MQKADLQKIPNNPGVYLFQDAHSKTLYVGKAGDLSKRVPSYFRSDLELGPKTTKMVKESTQLEFIKTETEFEALLLEADLIKRLKPKYNSLLKDDKSYKYIQIAQNREIPTILMPRTKINSRDTYFGPFPDGTATTLMVKDLRRMIGFCTQKKLTPGKPCFHYHLGLCPGYCAGLITKTEYLKNMKIIVQLLKGKRKKIVSDLECEMHAKSAQLKFEEAKAIKEKIERIVYISQSFKIPSEYLINPNLTTDIRNAELIEISKILNVHKVLPKTRPLIAKSRIECYDMANIGGKLAVGVMVVFVNGEPVKKDYRKFLIRFAKRNSDVDFMEEVLKRRITRMEKDIDGSFSHKPDLIIVDGGLPQLSAVKGILKPHKIPVIGIAKKYERLVFPIGDYVKLDASNPGLKLVQRLRDEAHRFSTTYHKLIRSKAMFKSSTP